MIFIQNRKCGILSFFLSIPGVVILRTGWLEGVRIGIGVVKNSGTCTDARVDEVDIPSQSRPLTCSLLASNHIPSSKSVAS